MTFETFGCVLFLEPPFSILNLTRTRWHDSLLPVLVSVMFFFLQFMRSLYLFIEDPFPPCILIYCWANFDLIKEKVNKLALCEMLS